MSVFHSDAFVSRWQRLSLVEQLANIGSEVERALKWRMKKHEEMAVSAFERSLDLIDLSLADRRWKGGALKEIARLRELYCDFFMGSNTYEMSESFFSSYFLQFAIAARRGLSEPSTTS